MSSILVLIDSMPHAIALIPIVISCVAIYYVTGSLIASVVGLDMMVSLFMVVYFIVADTSIMQYILEHWYFVLALFVGTSGLVWYIRE